VDFGQLPEPFLFCFILTGSSKYFQTTVEKISDFKRQNQIPVTPSTSGEAATRTDG